MYRAMDEGNRVAVRIRGTGVGIPEERLTTIFDPSFSASGSRVMMGTGLTTALRVVQTHGKNWTSTVGWGAGRRGKCRVITASRVR